MPAPIAPRYFSGTLRSIQKVIGLTGSDSAAAGSFFSSRQRVMWRWRGVRARSSLKSSTVLVNRPTRGSALRGVIIVAGIGASE